MTASTAIAIILALGVLGVLVYFAGKAMAKVRNEATGTPRPRPRPVLDDEDEQ